MRRIALFASFVCILFACRFLAAETVASMPAPTAYVDDYAEVLSASGRQETEALCRQLHDRTKAQIFVVTIKTLDGASVEQFANELFHQWKIGESKTDRGVLLLFAIDDHKRRIEVGYGLEGILNDAKVGDIGREMVPALRAQNYDQAVEVGTREVAEVIAADGGVSLDGGPRVARAPMPVIPILILLVVGVGFLLFVWLLIRAARRNRRAMSGGQTTLFSPPVESDPGVVAPIDWNRSFGSGAAANDDSWTKSSAPDTSSSFDTSSSVDTSSSDFSGGGGGDSGGGGASGDW